jgi:hypothetical protein
MGPKVSSRLAFWLLVLAYTPPATLPGACAGSFHRAVRRVTFSAPAMTAKRVAQALSARTGVHLECAPETRGEVLLLSVHSRPLREVMDRLGEAASAKWVPVRGGFRLTRAAEVDRSQRDAEVSERARWLQRSLQRISGGLDRPLDAARVTAAAHFREDSRENAQMLRTGVSWMDPALRMVARCLREIGAKQLASVPDGDRVVWATDPTPMQHPLGPATRDALRRLVEEQSAFGEALRQANASPGFEDEVLRDGGDAGFYHAAPHRPWDRLAPYPEPARVLLAVTSGSLTYDWDLIVLDARRRIVLEMSSFDADELRDEPSPSSGADPNPARSGPSVRLSPTSRLLVRSLWQDPNSTVAAPPELAALLTRPEAHEPLSLIASDGYLGLARARGANLVACLPDRLLYELWSSTSDARLPLSEVARWPCWSRPMRIRRKGSWLVVAPPDPYQNRRERIDRRVLGAIARRVRAGRRVAIEDEADFLAWGGEEPDAGFARAYFSLLAGHEAPLFIGGFGRLYGALDERQRRDLLAGRQINFGSLSARQRRLAEQVVYGSHVNLLGGSTGRHAVAALSDEPTEAFPDGLPPDRGLRGTDRQEHLMEFLEPGARPGSLPYERVVAEDETPGFYEGPGMSVPRGGFGALQFRVRPFRNIHIEVDDSPWSWVGENLRGEVGPATGPPVPFEKLPRDLQRGVSRWIDWLKWVAGVSRTPTPAASGRGAAPEREP